MKLSIITLKKFFISNNQVFTYGGFGEYLNMMLTIYDEIEIIAPVSKQKLAGQYKISDDIKIIPLHNYTHELDLIFKSIRNWPIIYRHVKKAEVVNPRIPDLTGLMGILAAKWHDKPHFISVQSDLREMLKSENFTGRNYFLKLGMKLWFRFYVNMEEQLSKNSMVICQGEGLMKRFSKKGRVVYPWISTTLREHEILPLKLQRIKTNRFRVCIIARNAKQKRVDLAYRSLLRLSEKLKVDVIFIGKGIKNLGFKSSENMTVLLKDTIPRGEVKDILDENDFLLLTSGWEGTPKVVVEAMARGVIPIVTPVKGLENTVVNGYTGFICDGFDERDIYNKLVEVAKLDEDELNSVSTTCLLKSAEFTIDAQKKIYNQIRSEFES